MKISGFRKTSLIDYPGYLSTIVFTQGCNFRCPYCHNPELIPMESDSSYMDLDYFWHFLKNRSHLIDGVVITGGEPTLQQDIVDFVSKIKEYDLRIKLDTNGSNLKVIEELIQEKLIDYIAMDIKHPLKKYNVFSQNEKIAVEVEKTLSLILNSKIDYEFRTTVVPGLHEKEDIKQIATLLKGAKMFYLQGFRPDKTYDPALKGLTRFPESKLLKFKELAKNYLDNVEIRE